MAVYDLTKPVEALVVSVWAPWADLIATGPKTIETRTWATRWRGPIVILCTKTKNKDTKAAMELYQSDAWEGGPLLDADYVPSYGKVLALATLSEVRPMMEADKPAALYADHWSIEYWHSKSKRWQTKFSWVLEDVMSVEPFDMNGKQSPFRHIFQPGELRPIATPELCFKRPCTTTFTKRQLQLPGL